MITRTDDTSWAGQVSKKVGNKKPGLTQMPNKGREKKYDAAKGKAKRKAQRQARRKSR